MRKQYKLLVEYPPDLPVEHREAVDRKQMQRLKDEHPNAEIVKMARQLVSDYRAYLFAELEWK